jgi:hypothetical protein
MEVAATVETLTVAVTEDVPLIFTGFGLTEQVELAGAPVHVKLTVPEKLLVPLTLKA